MPKQQAVVETISAYLDELRTLLEDKAYTSKDYYGELELINDIEILLNQLQ